LRPLLRHWSQFFHSFFYGRHDDNGDGNKQKAEDDSSATLDDCDDNEVEQTGFDCIAIATNDVVIEPPEESATLFVCKEVEGNQELIPSDFEFIITGPVEDSQVPGGPIDDPDPDCPHSFFI
jgi:hypothetical protein